MDVKSKQLVSSLLSGLCKTSKNVEDLEVLLTALINPVQLPTNRISVPINTTGTIPDGFKSFTVANTGSATALLGGEPFPSGMVETFSAEEKNETVEGMTYDSQTSTLIISTVG